MPNTVVAYVCGNDFLLCIFSLVFAASCEHREGGELCALSEGKICPSLILPIHG